MGYEDEDITTLIRELRELSKEVNNMRGECNEWNTVDGIVIMTTAQASGLTDNISGCMTAIFTNYNTLSGTYTGL